MKKPLSLIFACVLCAAAAGTAACSPSGPTVAVPNDTTNEARALLLLEEMGCITLKEGAGITATVRDVVENPLGIRFVETEAAQLPRVLPDVDYAIINSNYALDAGLEPLEQSLVMESADENPYANIVAVRAGEERRPKTRALVAALSSQTVALYIQTQYRGAVLPSVAEPGNGYDEELDYSALSGVTISVAASPTPHAEILAVAAELLAARQITLKIIEFTDYIIPNNVVAEGEIDANYFQHLPYLEDFNAQNGTSLVSVLGVHLEPLGLYGGRQQTLEALTV